MKESLKTKVGTAIVEELLGGDSGLDVEAIIKGALCEVFEPTRMYGSDSIGHRIQVMIEREFVNQYVNKNFAVLAKSVDLEAIKNLVTIKIARSVGDKIS